MLLSTGQQILCHIEEVKTHLVMIFQKFMLVDSKNLITATMCMLVSFSRKFCASSLLIIRTCFVTL